jgi:cell division protein ZapA
MEHITVQILGRDYRLSCEPAERETLLAAVAHVDHNMQTVREQGKIAGTERIAVLAALNIAGELLSHGAASSSSDPQPAATLDDASKASVADPEILRRMQDINSLLDTALANQERLF